MLLTQLESKLGLSKRIRLEVLIEEVEGLANAEEIAVASPRLDALIFGVGDFSLSQGAPEWTLTSSRSVNTPVISGITPATR
jgi:citrate lyase subunit beta/citryl-CoA lyase